jgi:hypothetical protein
MLLLPNKQTEEAWGPSKKDCCFGNREAWDRKNISTLSLTGYIIFLDEPLITKTHLLPFKAQ